MKNIWMIMTLPLLMLSACSNDTDAVTEEITLTTPVIELGGMSASASRAASTMSKARLTVALYNNDNRVYNENRAATYTLNGGSWGTEGSLLTVTGGEGNYRAGLSGTVSINGTPAIADAFYAYRGSIGVQTNGNFTPDAALSAYSAAVLVNLKDANGTSITSGSYRINPVGLAKMAGFAGGADAFPHGTGEAVYSVADHPAYLWSTTTAQGDFCPGTYPATWTNGELQAGAQTEWPIFEVTYSSAGFNDDGTPVDGGIVTTWDVNYTGEITLDKGKLYSFTITLGLAKATITLDTPTGKPGWGPNVQEHKFDNSPNDMFKEAMRELKFVKETNSVGTFEVSGPNGLMVLNKWMTGSITFDKFKSLNFEGATNFTSSYSGLKQNIKLMTNITLPVVAEGESNWTPIGTGITWRTTYNGIFDGNGKTLKNLTINSTSDHVGLIGSLDEGAIRNLTLNNVTVKGNEYVGSIAGCNLSSTVIENCTVESGKVEGFTKVGGIVGTCNTNKLLTNCINYAKVTGYGLVGGIMGENTAPLKNCINHGQVNVPYNASISVSSQYVGGIAGHNIANISACSNYGSVTVNAYCSPSGIGGIVGCHDNRDKTIEGCFNFAQVKQTNNSGDNKHYVGGVIGFLDKGKCFASGNLGSVLGGKKVGGIIGYTDSNVKIYGCWSKTTSESAPTNTYGGDTNSDGLGYFNDRGSYNYKKGCYTSSYPSVINNLVGSASDYTSGETISMNMAIGNNSQWKWVVGTNPDTDWPTLTLVE